MLIPHDGGRLIDWRTSITPLLRTAVIGVPAALVSFVILLAASGPIMARAGDTWITESLFGAAVAATWMAVGLRAGSRTVLSALLLFGIGAVASWVLTLRVVHSVSAYYGMPAFVVACVSGIVTGTLLLRGRHGVPVRAWMAGAVAITSIGIFWNFWSDPPGDSRRFRDSAGASHRAGLFGAPEGVHFAWIPGSASMAGRGTTPARALIEFSPGSGHTEVLMSPVTDEATLAIARRDAAGSERYRIAQDVEAGSVPAILRHAPVPLWMDRGTVWMITRDVHPAAPVRDTRADQSPSPN